MDERDQGGAADELTWVLAAKTRTTAVKLEAQDEAKSQKHRSPWGHVKLHVTTKPQGVGNEAHDTASDVTTSIENWTCHFRVDVHGVGAQINEANKLLHRHVHSETQMEVFPPDSVTGSANDSSLDESVGTEREAQS